MTRNERLLMALVTIKGDAASTVALADLSSLPERTARRGLVALTRQRLVWSPVRGRWQLTPTGHEIAVNLTRQTEAEPSRAESSERTVLETLWTDGLTGLLRNGRGR